MHGELAALRVPALGVTLNLQLRVIVERAIENGIARAALGGLLLLVSSNGVFRSISTVNAKNAGSAAAGFELGRGARKLKLSTD